MLQASPGVPFEAATHTGRVSSALALHGKVLRRFGGGGRAGRGTGSSRNAARVVGRKLGSTSWRLRITAAVSKAPGGARKVCDLTCIGGSGVRADDMERVPGGVRVAAQTGRDECSRLHQPRIQATAPGPGERDETRAEAVGPGKADGRISSSGSRTPGFERQAVESARFEATATIASDLDVGITSSISKCLQTNLTTTTGAETKVLVDEVRTRGLPSPLKREPSEREAAQLTGSQFMRDQRRRAKACGFASNGAPSGVTADEMSAAIRTTRQGKRGTSTSIPTRRRDAPRGSGLEVGFVERFRASCRSRRSRPPGAELHGGTQKVAGCRSAVTKRVRMGASGTQSRRRQRLETTSPRGNGRCGTAKRSSNSSSRSGGTVAAEIVRWRISPRVVYVHLDRHPLADREVATR